MFALFGLCLSVLGASGAEARPSEELAMTLAKGAQVLSRVRPVSLEIVIQAPPGKKLNLKAPLALALSAEGVVLDQDHLGPEDAKSHTSSVSFSVQARGTRSGPAVVNLSAKYFICDERVCERRTQTRALALTVRNEEGGG